nr:signal peptidase [uncultured Chryseobacterium sp.]
MTNKLLTFVTVFAIYFVNAQMPPAPTPQPGGQGGNGTGSPSIPVDMYVYVLAIAAILMIVYFAKKYKTQKI